MDVEVSLVADRDGERVGAAVGGDVDHRCVGEVAGGLVDADPAQAGRADDGVDQTVTVGIDRAEAAGHHPVSGRGRGHGVGRRVPVGERALQLPAGGRQQIQRGGSPDRRRGRRRADRGGAAHGRGPHARGPGRLRHGGCGSGIGRHGGCGDRIGLRGERGRRRASPRGGAGPRADRRSSRCRGRGVSGSGGVGGVGGGWSGQAGADGGTDAQRHGKCADPSY